MAGFLGNDLCVLKQDIDIVAGNKNTIESLNESLEKARNLIGRVRQGLETEIALTRVPAGAPERRPPDLSALTPREKIKHAIGGIAFGYSIANRSYIFGSMGPIWTNYSEDNETVR